MNSNITEEFLHSLVSKRKELKLTGCSISWLEITPTERKELYEIAKERGLLIGYKFSGIMSYGISRNDAGCSLLESTRERAFEKLRTEFGAKARFWIRPKQLSIIGIDFYWRTAKLGVLITGPLRDDPRRGDPVRTRDSCVGREQDFDWALPPNMKGLAILKFPYYQVWHHPSDFLDQIKHRLITSGYYPKLRNEA